MCPVPHDDRWLDLAVQDTGHPYPPRSPGCPSRLSPAGPIGGLCYGRTHTPSTIVRAREALLTMWEHRRGRLRTLPPAALCNRLWQQLRAATMQRPIGAPDPLGTPTQPRHVATSRVVGGVPPRPLRRGVGTILPLLGKQGVAPFHPERHHAATLSKLRVGTGQDPRQSHSTLHSLRHAQHVGAGTPPVRLVCPNGQGPT